MTSNNDNSNTKINSINNIIFGKELNPYDIIKPNNVNNDSKILLKILMNRNPELSKNINNLDSYLIFSKAVNSVMNDYSMNKSDFLMNINANVMDKEMPLNDKNNSKDQDISRKIEHELNMTNYQINLNKSKFYFGSPNSNYSYLSNPNQLKRKSTFLLYNRFLDTKFNKLFSIFDKTKVNEFTLGTSNNISFKTFGYDSEYNLTTSLANNTDLKVFFGKKMDYYSNEFGVSENKRIGISLIKNFNKKSNFFRDYPYLDPSNYIETYYYKNSYSNSISLNSYGYSRKYEDVVPVKDSFKTVGLRYKKDVMFFEDLDYNNFNLKGDKILNFTGELEYKKYEDDTKVLTSNIFLRKFFFWEYLTLQSSIENKLIFSNKNLKNHQLSYVNDFKGIERFDRGIYDTNDSSSVRINKGVNAYLKFYNKLYLDVNKIFYGYLEQKYPFSNKLTLKNSENSLFGYNPLFSESKNVLLPYLHFNLLYQEKSDEVLDLKKINLDRNNIYLSGGIGLSFLSELFALEVFYNPLIKMNEKDVYSKFGFNIGID